MSLFFTICEVFLSSNISDVSELNINGSKIRLDVFVRKMSTGIICEDAEIITIFLIGQYRHLGGR
jgi:hypothetical protein